MSVKKDAKLAKAPPNALFVSLATILVHKIVFYAKMIV